MNCIRACWKTTQEEANCPWFFRFTQSITEDHFWRRLPRYLATAVLKLFTSGHHLMIETGRWKSIPQGECLHARRLKTNPVQFFTALDTKMCDKNL